MALKERITKEKIINVVLNTLIALFSIILMISIYTGVQIKLLGHDYANFFGYSMFEVQTKSMEETISAGDWIIVKLGSKVKLNDVITYKQDNEYITHRLVDIHNGTYVTQGDANNAKDDPIDQSQVIGKLDKILPGFGILRKTLFNPWVLFLLIVILYLIDSLTRENKKNNKFDVKVRTIAFKLWSKINNKSSDNKNKKEEILPELNNFSINDEVIVVEEDPKEEIVILEEKPEEIEENISKITQEQVSEITEISMPEETIDEEEITDIEIETDEIELEDYDSVADDLEKTHFFRIIPVDEGELDSTLLEIANYEVKEPNKNDFKNKKTIDEIIKSEDEEEDGLAKVDLDLIKSHTRRNKNLIDAMMHIKKDEINEIINNLLDEDKLTTNEPTIKNILITTFIHARYYNYYNEKNLEYRGNNLLTKIEKILGIIATELINDYSGADYKYAEKVEKYLDILKVVAYLDQGKNTISEIKSKREYYRNAIDKYFKDIESKELEEIVNSIIKIQKSYEDIANYFLKRFETNTFYLNLNKISNQKNYQAADLEHSIKFSKVYSNYIIDKTYNEGIIAEDKTPIMFILLLSQIIKDMINADFSNKYIINITPSLFMKEKKLIGLLNAIDDEYAKAHILFLIDFKDLVNNKKFIQRLRKSGFKFVIGFKNTEFLAAKNRECLYFANILFVAKNNDLEVIENYIPDDLQDKIVYDNIFDKYNSIEGE